MEHYQWSIYEKYCVGNKIFYNTKVLKLNLCDCNNGYILVKSNINVIAASTTQVSIKHRAPLTKCIKKIDETTLDDAEDLDLVMLMYNLTEYSSNYSKTTRSLWFSSKDEATGCNNDIANTNNFKSFKYKAKLFRKTLAQPNPNQGNGISKKRQQLPCH